MSTAPIVSYQTTFEVRDACLCLHLQRAARAVARRFDEALKPTGLTNGQFSLMMALNRPEPPPLGAVAELLAMDRTTLTAALKVLERRGWAASLPDAKDKRSRRLLLTPKGADVLARAVPIWRQTHAEVEAQLAGIQGADPDQLRRDLVALTI